jgi:hypothetical protein
LEDSPPVSHCRDVSFFRSAYRFASVQISIPTSAESTDPMRPEEGGRVLIVHLRPEYIPFVAGDFTTFRTVEHVTVPLGGGIGREMDVSIGEGFAPAPRDEVFEQRLRAHSTD